MEAVNHRPEVDFELDTFTVVVLYEGPRAREIDPDDVKRLLGEHLQYTIGLAQAGHLLAAGAIEDNGDGLRLTGLGFSSKSPDELRALIAEDPSMKAGLEAFKLVTYRCPKDAISFPGRVRD